MKQRWLDRLISPRLADFLRHVDEVGVAAAWTTALSVSGAMAGVLLGAAIRVVIEKVLQQ